MDGRRGQGGGQCRVQEGVGEALPLAVPCTAHLAPPLRTRPPARAIAPCLFAQVAQQLEEVHRELAAVTADADLRAMLQQQLGMQTSSRRQQEQVGGAGQGCTLSPPPAPLQAAAQHSMLHDLGLTRIKFI